MGISVTQNFDGVTAPSLPSGWTFTGSLVTSTTFFQSSPNSLKDNLNSRNYGSYDTTDSAHGYGITGSVYVYITSAAAVNASFGGIFFRGSAANLATGTTIGNFCYINTSGLDGDTFNFARETGAGGETQMATEISSSSLTGGWYKIGVSVTGSSYTATLQRISDSKYMKSDGTFQVGTVNAFSFTDTNVTSGDYIGVVSGNSSAIGVYMDDFDYVSTDAPSSSTFYLKQRIIRR